jgi:hypothetical protein
MENQRARTSRFVSALALLALLVITALFVLTGPT